MSVRPHPSQEIEQILGDAVGKIVLLPVAMGVLNPGSGVYTMYAHEEHAMNAPAIREKTINLRTTSAQKAVIERAAESSGKTRTAFILDATLQRAESVLADRTRFVLSDAQMKRFVTALDAPLPDPDALRALLSRTPHWAR